MSDTLANVEKFAFRATWNGTDLGAHDGIQIEQMYELEPLTIGTTGKTVLDHYLQVIGGKVKIQRREFSLTQMKAMCPWWSSGVVYGMPTGANVRLYQYAQILNLHPDHMGADVTRDLNFLKAVPLFQPFESDGVKDIVWLSEFFCYVDRSALPLRKLFTIGATS